MPFKQLPPLVPWPIFPRASILTDGFPANEILCLGVCIANISGTVPTGYLDGKFATDVDMHLFMRLMAKIAHGIFVASNSDSEWKPLLQDPIRFGQLLPYYVGTLNDEQTTLPEILPPSAEGGKLSILYGNWIGKTRIARDSFSEYLVVIVEPVSLAYSPRYEIVTARRALPNFGIIRGARQMILAVSPQVQYISEPARIHIGCTKS